MAADGSVVIDVVIDTEELAGQLDALSGVISSGVERMGAGVSQTLAHSLADSIGNAREASVSAVAESSFEGIGTMISQGLANGVRNGLSAVLSAASTVVESAKSVITDSVKVQSPSKWAEEVGAFIGQGLANGVRSMSEQVSLAAKNMMDGLIQTVSVSAEEITRIEIAELDAVIEAEKRSIKERERERQLELRRHSADIAVEADVKRRALEYLYTTERQYALEDLEEYRKTLLEKQKAYEDAKKAQIDILKDVSDEELTILYDDTELKIRLYNEEYLERVRTIDEGLYAFLSAKNAEMEAVIERIALEDSAAAERLKDIIAEKEAIIEKSRLEAELREEKQRQEREAELLKRIWEAQTAEEQFKRHQEYLKWREDEEYRAAEKGRKERIAGLESEYAEIINTVREAQKEIDALRSEGDAAISNAADGIKTGAIDLGGEKEIFELSEAQQKEYLDNSHKLTADYYERRAELIKTESGKEYSYLQDFNNGITALLSSYVPVWWDIGAALMESLRMGLQSRLYEVSALINNLRAQLNSINLSSAGGGDFSGYPAYGTGGVVTTPRLAVVGDTPEAIIPLSVLNDVITQAALYAAPFVAGRDSLGDAALKMVNISQTNNIYQPVKSPSETARALKEVSRGLAEGV